MKACGSCLLALSFILSGSVCGRGSRPETASARLPRVFLLNPKELAATRQGVASHRAELSAPLAKLERDAQKYLSLAPVSILDKENVPPSGDKHDYVSIAPYFWPDPSKPNGVPYIRRDGETNPETQKYADHRNLDKVIEATGTLALAYYLDGEEAYANKAAQLLRVWFIDKATRMNPNLQYAQFVRGRNEGRGIGIIETRGLARLVDAVGLLAGSKSWTAADQRAIEEWFGQYLKWLRESKNGREEAASKNNHGTYYDVQVVSIALLTGQDELARRVLVESRQKRIATQIEPDGRQPLELARTKSWGYSLMNLHGLFDLASLGERAGVDLWNYRTADGRSLRKALDWLVPYAVGEKKWPAQQIAHWSGAELYPLLREAAFEYHDRQYDEAIAKLPAQAASDRINLLYPKTDERRAASN